MTTAHDLTDEALQGERLALLRAVRTPRQERRLGALQREVARRWPRVDRRMLTGLAALLLAGCCPRVPDTRPPVATCSSLGPPPVELPVVLLRPGEQGCPAGIARCIDAPNAAALADNIERLRAYARDAYDRCGPPVHQRRNVLP